MRQQSLYSKCREDWLKERFLKLRQTELFDLQTVGKYNQDLETKLVKLYLERCRYRHALSFVQFRRILPQANV